jgi:cytochrome c oxidase assembly protein subunit 15
MGVETPRLARLRTFELSQRRFLQLAVASAVSLWLIVVTGALVRLTASGLGCTSWPGCESTSFFPATDSHGAIEFGNRVMALFPLTLSLAVAVGAFLVAGLPRWARWIGAAVAVGTFAQAPLGLVTIKTDLHPLMVMSHFLLALAVLAGAVVVAVEAWHAQRARRVDPAPPVARRLGLVSVVALGVLVVTGAFVTAAGPHPGDKATIRRMFSFDGTVWLHVRATAVFGLAFLALLVLLWRRRDQMPRLWRAALAVLALLLVQMGVGEWQYRRGLPWEIVLAHVGLAGALWGTAVAFAALLWRSPDPART